MPLLLQTKKELEPYQKAIQRTAEDLLEAPVLAYT